MTMINIIPAQHQHVSIVIVSLLADMLLGHLEPEGVQRFNFSFL